MLQQYISGLKGLKHLAQGIALGINAAVYAP